MAFSGYSPHPGDKTVAAAATPVGRSAIGLIRVSGSRTFEVLQKIFKPRGRRKFPSPFCSFPGLLFDPGTGDLVDRVMVTTFIGPASYTGEDSAEIGVHGNPAVISAALAALFQAGVLPAEPGEFTRRAFLNGKMDLLDVEATAQIIHAPSKIQASIALNQLDGTPAKRLTGLRNRLLEHLTHVEAGINFPEDAIDEIDESLMASDFDSILRDLDRFLESARRGNLVSAGLAFAIVGRPNTGKSSLLNGILGRDRAIVSELPGTTRDTLEESWSIAGFPVTLIDTAGIRRPGDNIEALGIERSRKAIERSFSVIAVFDASCSLNEEDRQVLELVRDSGKPAVAALNKIDLSIRCSLEELKPFPVVQVSAVAGAGIPELVKKLEETIANQGLGAISDLLVLGARQTDALARAIQSLRQAREHVGSGFHDLLSVDISETVRFLGMITGETLDGDTLDRIFERFCIGK